MADSTSHPAPRPTLKTISERTGFAVATVSRALKDAPDIGEKTKQRVRAAADELGYRPNRAGVRLRTGKTNVISLVLSAEEHVMSHTAQLIHAITRRLKSTPYHLIVTPMTTGDEIMDPVKYLVETGSADGVILNQTQPNDPRVAYLHERRVPFATHGRTDMGIDHAYFDFDNDAYGRIAVQALAARGRQRILLVAPPPIHSYGLATTQGARAAAAETGVELIQSDPVYSDSMVAEIEAFFERLAGGDPVDGVIFSSSSAAMLGIAALEEAGLVIGRDFDAVCKEAAMPVMKLFRRETIVVREEIGKAGAFLADALVQEIEGTTGLPRTALEVPELSG